MTNAERIASIKLMIATPFYEGRGYVSYILALTDTLKELSRLGINWITHFTTGDAYVDRAKNAIVGAFLQSTCTDLFMIDSDLGWDVEGFLRVLLAPYDLVGGVYPLKRNPGDEYPCVVYTTEDGTRQPVMMPEGVIKAMMIPGGFMRIRKETLKLVVKECDTYICEQSSFPGLTPNLFNTSRSNGRFIGEDVVFCKKWRDAGYNIYLEPRVVFSHSGSYGWRGSYHDYLIGQPKIDVNDVMAVYIDRLSTAVKDLTTAPDILEVLA